MNRKNSSNPNKPNNGNKTKTNNKNDKLNYQSRQGLEFSSDTPNFLLKLKQQYEYVPPEKVKKERPENDDEAPKYELMKGVTELEAKLLLGINGIFIFLY